MERTFLLPALICGLWLAGCTHPEPHPPTPPAQAAPMKMVRMAQLADLGAEGGLVYVDANDLHALTGGVKPEAYDPVLHDGLLQHGVGYTPIDPDTPDLGGFIPVPRCPTNCKRREGFGPCDCPPDLNVPSVGGGGTVVLPDCFPLRNGCKRLACKGTCATRVVRFGKRFLWISCQCSGG